MKQNHYHIARLIEHYLRDEISEADLVVLNAWLEEDPAHRELLQYFEKDKAVPDMDYLLSLDGQAAWERFSRTRKKVRRLRIYYTAAAAAAVLLFMSALLGVFRSDLMPPEEPVLHASENIIRQDVPPGGNKAFLKLSDGTFVDLEAYPDRVKERDGTEIVGGEGQVMYQNTARTTQDLLYNTLVVPKAGTYQITLSDGTKVWLNAMSELRYPVVFGDENREVFLSGEAYFEVAHDTGRPFHVRVNNNTIEVLGTHFNVNAYTDVMSTTLIEGSVKVSNNDGERILVPGQEAKVGQKIEVQAADIMKVMAWKKGDFYFRSDHMPDIMGQLSRWYDVEFRFATNVPKNKGYSGSIPRNVHISEVLAMLSHVSGAVFTLEHNIVTIRYK